MKATIKQLIDANPAITLLLDVKKMPVKASYAVSKLAKAVASEFEHFNEQRNKAFKDAGCTLNDKNEYVHEDPQVVKDVVARVEEMQDVTVEFNALPLDLEQFGNAELPGAAFFGLEWAMKE